MLRSLGLISVREHNRFVERLCEIHRDTTKTLCDKIEDQGKKDERRRVEHEGLRREYNELADKHNAQGREILKLRTLGDENRDLHGKVYELVMQNEEVTKERDDAVKEVTHYKDDNTRLRARIGNAELALRQ